MTRSRRRAVLHTLAAVALAAFAATATGVWANPAAAQSPAMSGRMAPDRPMAPLRLMTFNIHHGEGLDGRLDLDRIAQVIIDARADIVGLQEVDRGVERTQRRDLLKELADRTGLRFAFGKNLDLQGGDYGNAVLSRFPIVSEGNRLLEPVGGGEQRGVLQTVLDVAGRQVLVLTTHFDHRRDSPQRPRSAEQVLEMARQWGDGPLVILGDFNDVPGSTAHATLTSILTDAWTAVGSGDGYTIPVAAPTRRIDWILLRGLAPETAEVVTTDASDHRPLLVTATLSGK
jgi:endonuclease/exonuclease/phosphatase family metal-dependent hydrolase